MPAEDALPFADARGEHCQDSVFLARCQGEDAMIIEGQQPNSNAHQGQPNANGSGNQGNGNPSPDEDESWFNDPVKVKEYVKNLRSENKQRRLNEQTLTQQFNQLQNQHQGLTQRLKATFGSTGEEGNDISKLPPEQQVEILHSAIQEREEMLMEREAEIEFLRVSSSLGIHDSKEQRYFQFLINEHMADKEDGYELAEEDLQEIVNQVAGTRQQKPGTGAPSSSSFSRSTVAPPDSDTHSGQVTVEAFKKMGTMAKSQLYAQNPDLYNQLAKQARAG